MTIMLKHSKPQDQNNMLKYVVDVSAHLASTITYTQIAHEESVCVELANYLAGK